MNLFPFLFYFRSINPPSFCFPYSPIGKSTLLSLIFGLLKPVSGDILINSPHPSVDCAQQIGYMLQHDELFEWRTIYKNITLGLEIQGKLNEESRQRAQTLLHTYGLYDFRHAYPAQLSGGMRQRAALIRTLVLEPSILLLDEPFSALDYQTRLNAGNEIGQILRKEQKTAILVTHDLGEAVSLADRVIILSKRPATVQKIVSLSFDPDSNTPFLRRNTPEFKHYFNLIWKELNTYEAVI